MGNVVHLESETRPPSNPPLSFSPHLPVPRTCTSVHTYPTKQIPTATPTASPPPSLPSHSLVHQVHQLDQIQEFAASDTVPSAQAEDRHGQTRAPPQLVAPEGEGGPELFQGPCINLRNLKNLFVGRDLASSLLTVAPHLHCDPLPAPPHCSYLKNPSSQAMRAGAPIWELPASGSVIIRCSPTCTLGGGGA